MPRTYVMKDKGERKKRLAKERVAECSRKRFNESGNGELENSSTEQNLLEENS